MVQNGTKNPCREKGYREVTDREYEVLYFASHGLSVPQISKELSITEFTTKTHITQLLWKMEVNSRLRLILKAIIEEIVIIDKDKLVYNTRE